MYSQYSTVALFEYIGLKSSSQKQYMSVIARNIQGGKTIRAPIYAHDWEHYLCIVRN